MDQFYEDLKQFGMGVEYELNKVIKEKLDEPELVEAVKFWLQLIQVVTSFIEYLLLTHLMSTSKE
ncbi:hypothetical protein LCL96_20730 [Rossellomorea aquimaris]|uniref:hypothetical protein n=1 Tax=Rossellomorea aquimaris TaxID=189382 RepID=UPI001CD7D616|nr:hypothetical protein [Rossellomorea aquimaris]MCA1061346.1 hypothetical protein [Rossellomorea aquimaris]